ncbi:AraC family transcriptional regulator [Nocardioides sp. NPDC127503]|uniref:AraC family transcriptional regulator n=1 Tax=Nocardioides sp. NPDC127503 TaxID=3154516 RepID=UPI003320F0B3
MEALPPTGTDPLAELLGSVRTTGAVFSRTALSGTWGVRFEDGSPLALAVPLRGTVWVTVQGGEPVRLEPGDVGVLSGGAPYTIASDTHVEADGVVRPGGHCEVLRPGPEDGRVTVDDADTLLLNGLCTVEAGAPARLLAALPPLALVPAAQGNCPVGSAALEDAIRPAPGQQALLDRTIDLMLMTALRAWFTRPGAETPAWYRAHSDPVVGHALRLLDDDLARPWTVESLAAATGVSRAALARNFTDLVGLPPMTYLREQRLDKAAELLHETGTTIGAVARRVGFSSAFALSTAFKKARGVSPSAHRGGR